MKFYIILIISVFVISSVSDAEEHGTSNLGRELFIKNRCVNCHTIGRGRFVGPDLSNVSKKYTKEEIINWIENPNQVYQITGKKPVNDGYPPMPPINVPKEEAEVIADYLVSKIDIPDDSGGGVIKGKVLNKSKGIDQEGVEIILTAFIGDRVKDQKKVVSDGGGNYEFKNLPWNSSYALTINYNGAEYTTEKTVFVPGEDVKQFELPIYEPTTDESKIKIMNSHVIIEVLEDLLNVANIIVLQNTGNEIYIGNETLFDGKRHSLIFNLPDDISNLELIHGLSKENVVQVKGGFADTTSILPGIRRIVYSYTVPLNSGKNTIKEIINYPTESFLLFISDSDENISVSGLSGDETVEIDGQEYKRWVGNGLNPGSKVIITFSRALSDIDFLRWVSLAVFLGLLCLSLIYSSFIKSNKLENISESDKKNLSMEKKHLIKEIVQLDDDYENKRISKDEYLMLRNIKKKRIAEINIIINQD